MRIAWICIYPMGIDSNPIASIADEKIIKVRETRIQAQNLSFRKSDITG
jgi:hypothetical protein